MEQDINSLFEDFQKVQAQMPIIGQNKTVKGAFTYKYADLEKIWEKVNPIISANHFIVTHEVTTEGVKTTAIHSSGEKLESLIPSTKTDKPQDMGKIITYYKRYNICAIFNIIIADEDNDAKLPNADFAKPNVDIAGAIKKLRTSKNLDELKVFWNSLSKVERGDSEVEAVKEEMKSLLQ